MFGISRGAFVVRSVAGILRDATNDTLINQVYDLYRSVDETHHTSLPEMKQFRGRVSFAVPTPIKFMGLFDTVGSRGIPKLNYHAGVGFEWPEFHDNYVSTAVDKVYHAVAIDNGDLGGDIIRVTRVGPVQYPSQTYQNYIAYMQAVGRDPRNRA